jgi:hypothetical protein
MSFNAPASLLNQDANTLSISFSFSSTVDAPNAYQFFTDDVALVSAMVTEVPEPSTWALMLAGFGSLVFMGWWCKKPRGPPKPVAHKRVHRG